MSEAIALIEKLRIYPVLNDDTIIKALVESFPVYKERAKEALARHAHSRVDVLQWHHDN
jgi:hypothetical protein